jgi:hypothetical protein
MRIHRAWPGVVALVLSLGLVVSPAEAHQGAVASSGPCQLIRGNSETVQAFSKRLITCAAGRWPTPGGAYRGICIADRESGLVPTATSPRRTYLGLFQHSSHDWPQRYQAWALPAWHLATSALNGRTNTIVTFRMVAAAGGWVAAGWPVDGC